MNQEQAASVLAVFQAAHGHVTVSGATAAVWYDHLRDVPADTGLEIARRMVVEVPRFPTPHEFWTRWKAERRRLAFKGEIEERKALPPPPPPRKERAKAWIAHARSVLDGHELPPPDVVDAVAAPVVPKVVTSPRYDPSRDDPGF